MFDFCFDLLKQMFQFTFDFMTSTELKEGVTVWALFIVLLVAGGVSRAILTHFSGVGLATSSSDTYDHYKSRARSEHSER